MHVLIINTSERTGGAAVAASRLQAALTHIGVEAEMLVRDRQTSSPKIHTFRGRWRMKWAFIRERLGIFFHLRGQRRGLFAIDTAVAGGNVTETDAYRRADSSLSTSCNAYFATGKPWFGRCTTSGPSPAFVIWPCLAPVTAKNVDNVPTFRTAVRPTTCRTAFGRKNKRSMPQPP